MMLCKLIRRLAGVMSHATVLYNTIALELSGAAVLRLSRNCNTATFVNLLLVNKLTKIPWLEQKGSHGRLNVSFLKWKCSSK